MIATNFQEQLTAAMEAAFPQADDRVSDLYAMAEYHLGWRNEKLEPEENDCGKLIRPRLCVISGKLVGADPAKSCLWLLRFNSSTTTCSFTTTYKLEVIFGAVGGRYEVSELMNNCEARQYAEELALQHTANAQKALDLLAHGNPEAVRELQEILEVLLHRNR